MGVVALAGGVGASKLLLGMSRVMNPGSLIVIVNTGDDLEMHGLSISPDLDIVTYTLAGAVDAKTGWGLRGDTFTTLQNLNRYGREQWFHLGDHDLATHIHRTALLRAGATLSETADTIRRAWGVTAQILPMSDQRVPTLIRTEIGVIHFQEYLVKHRAELTVKEIIFDGVERARPAPGTLEAIRSAEGIVVCPSNPLISIGPILAVPGLRDALCGRRERVVAVCPIVAGKSLKGPSDKMMKEQGHEVSALGVARLYADFVGTMLIDPADAAHKSAIEALRMRVELRPTLMRTTASKVRLARDVLSLLQKPAFAGAAR
ncbi:MAG TPA: 2-phospho-L-lactate transferase [Candidatus Acidoferrales bacterium]|jgi:LPPG:FO 2-phospho-L-lactate transferase|nr:2-phospho-L-lactate transferase [Candidatus Acidoferrales bacterium]